ncbi:MAG: hypothetical protein VXY57_01815 [Actinomycetota bacterium]|nr:hypothetical protein [Actinomycetota bacterium]
MIPLYPYLIGVISLTLAIIFAIAAFIYHQRKGRIFDRYFQRLPMAVRFEDLEARVSDLQEERDRIQSQLDDAKATVAEADRTRKWMEENQSTIAKMKAERDDLETVSRKYGEIQRKLDEARIELANVTKETSRLAASLEGDRERSTALTKDIEALTKSVTELEARERVLKKEAEELQSRMASMERTKQALDDEIEALEKRCEDRQNELQRLESEMERARKELEKARDEMRATREEEIRVEGRVQDAKTRLASTVGTERTGEIAVEELWSPSIEVEAFEETGGNDDEFQALGRVHDHLESHGLVFPRRTLSAFHTSLKIGMETPLLVLAGISGTGKSLLPRRYAEAMGIHFLPIAVQPRWDGPQDMLGFFNHLEGKYKATELVRALIQMDPIAREWHPETVESAHDRVLLVLLDEMNLARVEYYFSDFLSRLEARREITDIDSASDRRPAEIPLEVGGLLDDSDDAGRILVWNNVLFVGSMNEDESTLSLSDKVIDRANIMRFGRPPVVSQPNAHTETAHLASKGFLHADVWQQWIDDGNRRDLPPMVARVIEESNGLLDKIGRPFGYRVSRAIESYVKQHPERDPNIPLADQIEQRIMPKLRGLDLHDAETAPALKGFEEIAGELGDEELALAIRKGAESNSNLFLWRGVERTTEDG